MSSRLLASKFDVGGISCRIDSARVILFFVRLEKVSGLRLIYCSSMSRINGYGGEFLVKVCLADMFCSNGAFWSICRKLMSLILSQ